MLLIITNSLDAHVNYLAPILERENIAVLRFDTDRSVGEFQIRWTGDLPCLVVEDRCFHAAQFTNVWYRRPERLIVGHLPDSPESRFALDEWTEALEGFFALIPAARWANHPSANVAASHKIEQLTRAKSLGFSVPETLLTQDPASLRAFYDQHSGHVIAKPLARGYVERSGEEMDSLIYTTRLSADHLDDLDDLRECPTLFQQEIDKQADVRITAMDGEFHVVELLAADETGNQRCDIRRNNMEDVTHRQIELPEEVHAKLVELMRGYSLRFAAIDMAITRTGEWVFFEVNPNGQWAWMDLAGVTNIASSFVRSFAR